MERHPADRTLEQELLSFETVGGLAGLTKLVDYFYQNMDGLPEAKLIRAMHPDDLTVSKDKLVCFLSGWLGGPSLYQRKYGSLQLPMAHKHLNIDTKARESWLFCMKLAVQQMGYSSCLQEQLIQKLNRPAESIQLLSEFHHK